MLASLASMPLAISPRSHLSPLLAAIAAPPVESPFHSSRKMMSWLDTAGLSRLQDEFHQSMRSLLLGLCRDITRRYGDLADQLDLPVDYFRFLAQSLDRTFYSNWKVVGWI